MTVSRLTALACITGLVFLASAIGVAQQASTQSAGDTGGQSPPQSGPVPVSWFCDAWGASPYFDDPISMTLSAESSSTILRQESFYNYGEVSGVIDGQVMLGRVDVRVDCSVSVWADWAGHADATSSYIFVGRYPQALSNDADVETFTYTAPGDYLRRREYFVRDQYDWLWGFVDSVTEWFEESGENGCNLTIQTSETSTNAVGRFEDRYGNVGAGAIPACQIPEYQSCQSHFNQFINVIGVTFDHPVRYTCYDVYVSR